MRVVQPFFAKGEVAPELQARFDVHSYLGALECAQNVVVLRYGGVTKRPGTRFVGTVDDETVAGRLLPFRFNFFQSYPLEFGHGYMRPMSRGGEVLEEELAITAISQANPAVVTCAFHGYAPGDRVFLRGISGMKDLNMRVVTVVSVIDANRFSIDVSTLGMPAFVSAAGGITRAEALPAPPEPPVIPPPVPPPAPPPVTGGGGGRGRGNGTNEV